MCQPGPQRQPTSLAGDGATTSERKTSGMADDVSMDAADALKAKAPARTIFEAIFMLSVPFLRIISATRTVVRVS
jgi:hypothetical protein